MSPLASCCLDSTCPCSSVKRWWLRCLLSSASHIYNQAYTMERRNPRHRLLEPCNRSLQHPVPCCVCGCTARPNCFFILPARATDLSVARSPQPVDISAKSPPFPAHKEWAYPYPVLGLRSSRESRRNTSAHAPKVTRPMQQIWKHQVAEPLTIVAWHLRERGVWSPSYCCTPTNSAICAT